MTDYGNTTVKNASLRQIPIKVSGIYRITNTLDGKIYIGSAVDIRRRLRGHLIMLRDGRHTSPQLQRAFNRDGEHAFAFDVLELCGREIVLQREQVYIDTYKSYEDAIGYNTCKIAGSGPTLSYTDQMRSTVSNRFRGKPKSAEHRRKIGESQKHRTCSPEKRAEISASVRKYWSDPANRKAQSERKLGRTKRGVPHTEASKRKLSEAKKGKPNIKGRHYPDEAIDKWIEMRRNNIAFSVISYEYRVPLKTILQCIKRRIAETNEPHYTGQCQGVDTEPHVHERRHVDNGVNIELQQPDTGETSAA